VLHGELPDRPKLKQLFQDARDTYQTKLRPLLLARHGIGEAEAAGHEGFGLDDKLVKTLLLSALVPEVPALHNLNRGEAARAELRLDQLADPRVREPDRAGPDAQVGCRTRGSSMSATVPIRSSR